MKYIITTFILLLSSFKNYAQDTCTFLKNAAPFITENFHIQNYNGYLNAKTNQIDISNSPSGQYTLVILKGTNYVSTNIIKE